MQKRPIVFNSTHSPGFKDLLLNDFQNSTNGQCQTKYERYAAIASLFLLMGTLKLGSTDSVILSIHHVVHVFGPELSHSNLATLCKTVPPGACPSSTTEALEEKGSTESHLGLHSHPGLCLNLSRVKITPLR